VETRETKGRGARETKLWSIFGEEEGVGELYFTAENSGRARQRTDLEFRGVKTPTDQCKGRFDPNAVDGEKGPITYYW
jgi:hypothetical protein